MTPGIQSYIELTQRSLSQYGRIGATTLRCAPDVASLAVAPSATVSTYSAPVPIQFREFGTVIAMYGAEQTGTAAKFAKTRVRVQIGGSEDLFSDGQAGVFVSMLSLFGAAQNWFPLLRGVEPGVQWVITYENRDTAAVAVPSLQLAVILDADVARMTRT